MKPRGGAVAAQTPAGFGAASVGTGAPMDAAGPRPPRGAGSWGLSE